MEKSFILSGTHFLLGDSALAEGAITGGCRFFAGYPITPSTETAERMAERLPQVGGIYLQMEDELGSMAAILGASWSGRKAMTATSGPGARTTRVASATGLSLTRPCPGACAS